MWWTIGKTLLQSYGLLWMTAVGGFLAANFSATIGTLFFVPENKAVYVRPWMHTGWSIGVALFFAGAVFGKLRFIQGTALGDTINRPADHVAGNEQAGSEVGTSPQSTEDSGAAGFILMCGLAGGFLGALLGGSLMVFPLSYAYSPFATPEAVAAVDVVEELPARSARRQHVVQINNPTISLFLASAVFGVVAGMMGGGFVVWKYGGGKPSA